MVCVGVVSLMVSVAVEGDAVPTAAGSEPKRQVYRFTIRGQSPRWSRLLNVPELPPEAMINGRTGRRVIPRLWHYPAVIDTGMAQRSGPPPADTVTVKLAELPSVDGLAGRARR